MSRPSPGHRKHRPPWWVLYPDYLDDLEGALRDQPLLRLYEQDGAKSVRGRFQVLIDRKVADSFLIRIALPSNYPKGLPTLYEIDGRIPRIVDRHINSRAGEACLYVPEEWLAKRKDDRFSTFLNVAVRNFFLAQLYFEQHRRYPHGERPHYGAGMIEAYADILGIRAKVTGAKSVAAG